MKNKRYLVLGDVHGQYDRLCEILDEYFDIADKVVFLGDYIDKNKESLKTLEFILDKKDAFPEKVELIWGNHDIFLLNSVLYNDSRLFYTWFYLNNAYRTTLFDYVPGNDRVLFGDGYDEFVAEYHDKISNEKYFIDLSKRLLNNGRLFYRDEEVFCIHGGIPINITRRNDFKFINFYKNGGIEGLNSLEYDYKNGDLLATNFFGETQNNDPTWFGGATYYESMNIEGFQKLLDALSVSSLFVGHRDGLKAPKFPKGEMLHCLNMGSTDIGYYFGEA